MRIALIGQAAFGAKVLETLLGKGHEVVAVYTSPMPERALPLKELAEEKGIRLFQPRHMRDPEVYESLRSSSPDFAIMAFVTDIVPARVLACPRLGTIQYHPSLLPRHRGSSAINWAIIHGDTETGLTIFWPDGGIDTGPVLLQKKVRISPDDTVGSLYFGKLFALGVQAMVESVELVEQSKAPRIAQDNSLATYEPPCEERHALIDWSKPVSEVYNLIRGTNPQPGATTSWRSKKVKVYDSEKLQLREAAGPGEIVDIGERGIAIACNDGAILAKRLQPQGSPKVAARDFARNFGLVIGNRFGT